MNFLILLACGLRLSNDIGHVQVFSRTGKAAAVQAKTISDISRCKELDRPRLTSILLQWVLGIVLEALSKPPYEP